MTNYKPSGKTAGSSGRSRTAKSSFADQDFADQAGSDAFADAERSEFHVEQPALAADPVDKPGGDTGFKGETPEVFPSEPPESFATVSESCADAPPAGAPPAPAMVSDTGDESRDTLGKDIKHAAWTATRAVKQQASEFASDIGHELGRTAEDQKRRGTQAMMGFARAIDSAAGEMESQSPLVARYVRDAARQVEGLSGTIGNRSVNDLMRAASDLARARPFMFFGGAIAAGIVLSRFLKSSAPVAQAEIYVPQPRPQGPDVGMHG